jgi:GT2 family glycosyltransferase
VDTVSVGVVNHNGESYLRATLAAVRALGPSVAEILLADDASTDGSVALVRRDFPEVRVIELGVNRGPGAVRNALIDAAAHDRLLLVDNDVRPLPGSLEALGRALDAHPNAALAMPTVLLEGEPEKVQYLGAEPHFMGVMALRRAGTPVSSLNGRVEKVGSVVSACLLVDRARLGPIRFETRYFIYHEDHEFGLRCRLLGRELLAVPAARCLHGEGTIGVSLRQTGRFTPVRVRYTILNRWRTLLGLYQGRTLLRFTPALAAFELVQLAGAVRMGWVGHWLWSARQIVRELPLILRQRRAFRRERRARDLDVLIAGPFPYNSAFPRRGIERAAMRAVDAVARLNWRLGGARS